MNRYKVGDEFKATLVIHDIEYEDNIPYYWTKVKELGFDGELESLSEENLDAAFDPTYKERMRQEKIARLEKELEELRNES